MRSEETRRKKKTEPKSKKKTLQPITHPEPLVVFPRLVLGPDFRGRRLVAHGRFHVPSLVVDSASRLGSRQTAFPASGGDAAARDGSGTTSSALAHQIADQHEADEGHNVKAVAVEPGLPGVVARGGAGAVASAGARRGHFFFWFPVLSFFFGDVECW